LLGVRTDNIGFRHAAVAGSIADHRDRIPVPFGLDLEHGKPGFFVEESDALDQLKRFSAKIVAGFCTAASLEVHHATDKPCCLNRYVDALQRSAPISTTSSRTRGEPGFMDLS